jgi:hypothetical protein
LTFKITLKNFAFYLPVISQCGTKELGAKLLQHSFGRWHF